jgi:hypothetical protein
MKKMLTVSNGAPFVTHIFRSTLLLLIGIALGTAFWVASTPITQAQGDMSPTKMIESKMKPGKAGKADYLAAVCDAVKQWRSAAPQIVRAAVEAHPAWKKDILRTAFQCLGTDDCRLLSRVLRGAIAGSPNDASGLTETAIEAAPSCSSSFGGGAPGPGDEGEGNFGNPPGNLNPPPGSIGGGGGQGNVIVVCFHGETLFVSPERAQELVGQGATVGACQVTATVNQ